MARAGKQVSHQTLASAQIRQHPLRRFGMAGLAALLMAVWIMQGASLGHIHEAGSVPAAAQIIADHHAPVSPPDHDKTCPLCRLTAHMTAAVLPLLIAITFTLLGTGPVTADVREDHPLPFAAHFWNGRGPPREA